MNAGIAIGRILAMKGESMGLPLFQMLVLKNLEAEHHKRGVVGVLFWWAAGAGFLLGSPPCQTMES